MLRTVVLTQHILMKKRCNFATLFLCPILAYAQIKR